MCANPTPDQSQTRILRTFTALYQLRPDWAGSLILSLGLNPEGSALSVAAVLAGAVSLAIDNDPTNLREIVRTGACDFVVTTLDEAIRAMKNEVRKRAPLSVALNADPVHTLDEILERGLSPQLFASFLPSGSRVVESATEFHDLGAILIDFNETTEDLPGFRSSQSILAPLLEGNGWTLQNFIFDTPTELRSFDAAALALLPPEDTLRRRWLDAAPRILQRQRPPGRTLWLSEFETASLRKA